MALSAIVLLLGLATVATADDTYGVKLTVEATTPIADVIAKPSTFAGKTVRVEGVVTAVCEHMGCWMTLAPAGAATDAATLRLKVDDGVIVFPVSAKGRTAVAQGVVEPIAGDDHHATEPGKFHLKVTGAVVR
jgi:hypothetical protein